MATAQKTSVEALRRELELRFEDEQFHEPQGASELLSELVLEPLDEAAAYPLFFHQILSRGKETARAGRRVPSRSEGAAAPSSSAQVTDCHPPLNSMGVTKHGAITAPFKALSSAALPCPSSSKIMGGYDGGFEAGFIGEWQKMPAQYDTGVRFPMTPLAQQPGKRTRKPEIENFNWR